MWPENETLEFLIARWMLMMKMRNFWNVKLIMTYEVREL